MLGIDANAAGLYDGFLRARKARLTNTLFVVASAESLPGELNSRADEVRIQFPWASLLNAVLRGDRAMFDGVARVLRPGGRVRILLSVTEHDRIPDMAALDGPRAGEVAARIANSNVGLVPEFCREAASADIAAAHSTWARRLGVGRLRPAWLLQFRKAGRAAHTSHGCDVDCIGEGKGG